MSKPREFYVYKNEDYAPTYAIDCMQRGFVPSKQKECWHVIEKAPVDKLLDEVEKFMSSFSIGSNECRKQRDELVRAIKEFRSNE